MESIYSFCLNMTAWHWMSFGVALFSFELMFPGVFMIWLAASAFATAAIVYLTGFSGIPAIATFLVLGVAFCLMRRSCKKCAK